MSAVLKGIPTILKSKQFKEWHYRQAKPFNLAKINYSFVKSSLKNFHYSMSNQDKCNFNETSQIPPKPSTGNRSQPLRYWKKLKNADQNKKGITFKVVSYNILSQNLLVDHLHLYSRCDQQHLKWTYRLPKLTEEIIKQKPDIICLQEVQADHLGDIMTNIKTHLPMSSLFKKKTGDKVDGCAILYNKNLFHLDASFEVELYKPKFKLLNRHNIALVATLSCKANPKAKFLVCTTHLLFNPARHDVRLAQIMVLLAELDKHSIHEPDKSQRMPIIITGDFNFQARADAFELITRGKLCYGKLSYGKDFFSPHLKITENCQYTDVSGSKSATCKNGLPTPSSSQSVVKDDLNEAPTGMLSHSLRLKSAYNHFDGFKLSSSFTGGWITVDHLFYNGDSPNGNYKGSLELLSVFQLPYAEQCYSIGPLPNANLSSDHLMLAALFRLTFPNV